MYPITEYLEMPNVLHAKINKSCAEMSRPNSLVKIANQSYAPEFNTSDGVL
jgi:hypothetical protein